MDFTNRDVRRLMNSQKTVGSTCVYSSDFHPSQRLGLIVVVLVLSVGGSPQVAAEDNVSSAVPFDVRGMDTLRCVALSPNGKLLVVGGGPWHGPGMFAVFDYPSGCLRFLNKKHRQPIDAIGFSSDSSRLATGGGDGQNTVWDVRTGRPLADFKGHRMATRSICFTPDGRRVITGGGLDNSVRMWDVATARPLSTFRFLFTKKVIEDAVFEFPERPHERAPLSEIFLLPIAQIYDVALSPDGNTIAVATEENCVRLWDPKTGKDRRTLDTNHTDGVLNVAFTSDGKRLATGGSFAKDGTVQLWDLTNGRKLKTFKGHRDSILHIVFSPDNKTLFTCSCFPDSTAKVWQADTGKELATLRSRDDKYGIDKLAVAPNGKILATVGGPNSLQFWDLQTFKEVQPWVDKREGTPTKGK